MHKNIIDRLINMSTYKKEDYLQKKKEKNDFI